MELNSVSLDDLRELVNDGRTLLASLEHEVDQRLAQIDIDD